MCVRVFYLNMCYKSSTAIKAVQWPIIISSRVDDLKKFCEKVGNRSTRAFQAEAENV